MTVAYINFHAPINQSTVQQLMATSGQLLKEGKNELYLMLSTPGGRVDSGVTLYNFLRAIPCELTTHNMGNIDSIGNAVFLAGKTRKACAHSTFMFHGVGLDIHQRFEEKNLREGLDSILADQRRIGDIIADRTRIPKNKAMQLFRDARTKSGNYHLDIVGAIWCNGSSQGDSHGRRSFQPDLHRRKQSPRVA